MPLEIEAKIKVDSFDAVRARLVELGAERLCRVLETNRILDTADRRLLSSGRGLRIRTCEGEGTVPPATLTYKGPQQAGALKVREELETGLDDPAAAIAILGGLGFEPALVFQKRRETWRLPEVTIELDELPRLGCYVEIEGPDEPAVTRTQTALGLAAEPLIRTSYIALLIDHARANGLPHDRVVFG
ncbi:MAG: class IV adenylate cyclase [Planctomycetes bacterium]|nr:class IV adenylate cyclase [Planctomycetota bacterium]